MNSPTTRPDEQRLAEVLRAEADRLVVTEDGLADLRARLARTPVGPRRSTGRRRGLAAGAAALALAAAVSVVVGIGLRPDATPPPVETPLPPPTAAPSYPAQPARSTVDVYRVRSRPGALPRLAVETVPITPPLDPRQAMEALFGLPPLNAADHSVLDDGRDVVASTRETEDALVVDLSAVDQVSRAPSRAVAEIWVQAWVRTLQSAYGSDKPVLITVRGRPTTLYDSVDTSRPIRSTGAPTVQDQRIFVPRPGQSVTSPVSFGANLPDGTFLWKVTDDAGRTVQRTGFQGDGGYGGPGFVLPPGRYRVSVTADPDSSTPAFTSRVDFEVIGGAPDPAPAPVADPPVTPLPTVSVYYASSSGHGLVRERRTRRDPVALLADYLTVPRDEPALDTSALGAANRIRTVTDTGDRLVLDFASLAPVRPSVPPGAQRAQAAAFVRTVQSVTGSRAPVVVTLDGRPARFLGQRTLTAPTGADAEVSEEDQPYPQPGRDAGRAEIVGTLLPGHTATWSLADAVSGQTRFQGRVPAVDPRDQVYAFSVAVPAGRYLLSVTSRKGRGSGVTTLVEVTVP